MKGDWDSNPWSRIVMSKKIISTENTIKADLIRGQEGLVPPSKKLEKHSFDD